MKYALSIFIISIFLFSATSALAFTFNRNLTVGSRGQDVYQLQKLLNTNPDTQVAHSGPGSPGNETTYFGALTKSAVIRYQNLFTEEILEPVGLRVGTGFVGPSTRSHMHAGTQQSATSDTQEQDQDVVNSNSSPSLDTELSSASDFSADLADVEEMYLFYPSQYTGSVGTTLTLHGAGFESQNTVHFGDEDIAGLSSAGNGTRISFTVPDVDPGYYALRVSNSQEKTDTDAFFIVTDNSSVEPVITSVTPENGRYAEEVVITGTGFTEENNQIRTSYGIVEGVPSADGTTLTFEVKPYPDTFGLQHNGGADTDTSWDISLNVINDGGVSNRETFTLEF